MPDFTAELANFVGWGTVRTILPNGGSKFDRFTIAIPGHQIEIVQRENALRARSNLRGDLVATSRVTVRDVTTFSQGEEVVTDLSSLLSFAQMSRIVPYNFRFEGEMRSYYTSGFIGAWRTPFRSDLNTEVPTFVERAWAPFQRSKVNRALPSLIHLIAYSDMPEIPVELKLLQVIVCLENVKAYWALSEGPRHGVTEATSGEFVRTGSKLSFETLLHEALHDVGMSLPTPSKWTRIKKVRNAIVHRGVIPPSSKAAQNVFGAGTPPDAVYHQMLEVAEDCHDIVREFVLRLLEYKGPYQPYSVPSGRGLPSQI